MCENLRNKPVNNVNVKRAENIRNEKKEMKKIKSLNREGLDLWSAWDSYRLNSLLTF